MLPGRPAPPPSAGTSGVYLGEVTRVTAAGVYLIAPRVQRRHEFGPCQAAELAPTAPAYARGDKVLVAFYEGRPDELAVVARVHAATPPGP